MIKEKFKKTTIKRAILYLIIGFVLFIIGSFASLCSTWSMNCSTTERLIAPVGFVGLFLLGWGSAALVRGLYVRFIPASTRQSNVKHAQRIADETTFKVIFRILGVLVLIYILVVLFENQIREAYFFLTGQET